MPLRNPPTSEGSAYERLNDNYEPQSLGELRRRAVSCLIEHDCIIPDPEQLDLIVKSAVMPSALLFSAALYHPESMEISLHFDHFVLSCAFPVADGIVL